MLLQAWERLEDLAASKQAAAARAAEAAEEAWMESWGYAQSLQKVGPRVRGFLHNATEFCGCCFIWKHLLAFISVVMHSLRWSWGAWSLQC